MRVPRMAALALVVAATTLSSAALAQGAPPAAAAAPLAAEPPAAPAFNAKQLEDLVAPIALYPDALVMQILMASTYPLEIVQADRWRQEHKELQGDALGKALEQQSWDPSVEALTYFPDVLARMSKSLDWTTDMGNAFLGQQADVMDAIQRMRKQAYDAGTLKSTPQQKVDVAPAAAAPPPAAQAAVPAAAPAAAPPPEIITVQPTNPQMMYAPAYPPGAYGPSYAGGSYYSGMYPPPSAYPPGYNMTTNLLSFGVGMALGGLIWGDSGDSCDWGNHVVYGGGNRGDVNINTGDINVNRKPGNRQQWQHDPQHRRGVAYKDPQVRQKYASAKPAPLTTKQARGFENAPGERDRGAAANRPGGQAGRAEATRTERRPEPKAERGGAAAKPANRPAAAPARQAKARPEPAARPASAARPRDDAFSGAQNGRFEREASARGATSRAAAAPGGGLQNRAGGGEGGRAFGGGGGGGGRAAGGGGRPGGGGGGGGRRR